MRTTTFVLTLATLLLALASPAAAQDPNEVLKAFKASNKQVLKDFKVALKEASATLDLALGHFASHFDDLVDVDTPVEDLAAALITYQTAVWYAHNFAALSVATAAGDAIAQVSTGGSTENVLPVGLLVGDGGTLDDTLAALNVAAAKAVVAPNKVLAKLAKKLRSKTDMRFSAVLMPARPQYMAPLSGDFTGGPQNTLTIDVVVGFDRGAVDDDGRFWASGLAGFSAGDVSLTLDGADFQVFAVAPDAGTSRWELDNSGAAPTVPEGNYFLYATQNAAAGASASLGIE